MPISKERLIELIQKSTKIELNVDWGGTEMDDVYHGELDDAVLHMDGTLELWHNPNNREI